MNAIVNKHKHLSRDIVESIAQIEVRAAFDKKVFLGPKQLAEIEDKVYT